MLWFLRWSGPFAFGSVISYSQHCFDVSRHRTRLGKSSVKIAQRQIVINTERASRCPHLRSIRQIKNVMIRVCNERLAHKFTLLMTLIETT